MSGMDHHATVDRGLRMKIKRTKNMGPASNKTDPKHEIVKSGDKQTNDNATGANGSSVDKTKQSAIGDSSKSPKVKNVHKKESHRFGVGKDKVGKVGDNAASLSAVSTSLDVPFSQVSLEPKQAETPQPKKESAMPDPYEFNAKVEDGLSFPVKKIKNEKMDASTSPTHSTPHSSQQQSASEGSSASTTEKCSVGVLTDPECLGPCEPGTSVTLDGIVWHETENGVLVVNVTWRDKTYVGTLLDATKHDWAPPRFNCDSPVSEFETRTPKGRAKRGRNSTSTPVNEKGLEGRKLRKGRKCSNTFQAPPSPAKSDISSSGGVKRKGRPTDIDLNSSGNKRSKSCSQTTTPGTESPVSNLIECPEPNCNKKYKHQNGLKYHQTHAHQSASGSVTAGTDDGDEDTRDTCDNIDDDDVEDSIVDQSDTVSENNNSANKTTKNFSGISEEDSLSTGGSNDKCEDSISNKTENEAMDEGDIDVGGDSVNKKDAVVSKNSVPVSKAIAKPMQLVPSGNAFQIVSSQHASLEPSIATVSMATQSTVQTGSKVIPITGAVVPKQIQVAIPMTVTTITTGISHTELKTDSSKTEKLIRPKISQPILPTPIVALTTNVSVTHTNAAPLTSTSQVTQLKPIQPKPVQPGETTPAIHPTLLGLKELKDRKSKQKKRDKVKEPLLLPSPSHSSSSSSVASSMSASMVQQRTSIVEPMKNDQQQTGVIKVAPIVAKPVEHVKVEPSIRHDRTIDRPLDKPLSLPLSGANVGVVTAQVQPSPKGIDLSRSNSRQTEPPSVLKVNSLPSLDNKSSINDNVQSPSYYSDISEESGSPAMHTQSESPQKNKDDIPSSSNKPSDMVGNVPPVIPGPPVGPSGMDGQGIPPYNMYGSYYGQSYVLPQAANLASPIGSGSGPGTPSQQLQAHQQTKSQTPHKDRQAPLEPNKSGHAEQKTKREETDEKEAGKSDKMEGGAQGLTQQEYLQMHHQKWVQQQMINLQIPPHAQYQFLATYGHYFDNTYRMHMMANDPMYRQQHERASEEEKRRMESGGYGGSGERREQDLSKMANRGAMAQDMTVGADNMQQSKSADPMFSTNKDSEPKRNPEFSDKDKVIRDKQDENHQIMKENIDLKDQMEKNRYPDQRYDQYSGMSQGNDEQARRMHMFQQQAIIRQQKREEQKKMDSGRHDNRPSENSAKTSAASHSSANVDNKSKDHGTVVPESNIKLRTDIKRENLDDKSYESSETKVSNEEKNKNLSSSTSDHRNRNFEMMKAKQQQQQSPSVSKVSSPHTVTSIPASVPTQSMPVAGGSPYNNYMYGQYMQQQPPPQYGQMSFDPNHPMFHSGLNPAMMYAGSNYLHPSQLPYRVGMEMDEKDKMAQKMGHSMPLEGDSKVIDPSHGPAHHPLASNAQAQGSAVATGASHKIHELQDKSNRSLSSPHRSSPLPPKSECQAVVPLGSVDKNREYSSSPPTQRHVHTHHHTHVVEAAYPVYPYTGMFNGASQQKTPPSAAIPPQPGHSSFPPSK